MTSADETLTPFELVQQVAAQKGKRVTKEKFEAFCKKSEEQYGKSFGEALYERPNTIFEFNFGFKLVKNGKTPHKAGKWNGKTIRIYPDGKRIYIYEQDSKKQNSHRETASSKLKNGVNNSDKATSPNSQPKQSTGKELPHIIDNTWGKPSEKPEYKLKKKKVYTKQVFDKIGSKEPETPSDKKFREQWRRENTGNFYKDLNQVKGDSTLGKKKNDTKTIEIMQRHGVEEVATIGNINNGAFLESKEFQQWDEFRKVVSPVELQILNKQKIKDRMIGGSVSKEAVTALENEIESHKKELSDINAFYLRLIGEKGLESLKDNFKANKELLIILEKVERDELLSEQEVVATRNGIKAFSPAKYNNGNNKTTFKEESDRQQAMAKKELERVVKLEEKEAQTKREKYLAELAKNQTPMSDFLDQHGKNYLQTYLPPKDRIACHIVRGIISDHSDFDSEVFKIGNLDKYPELRGTVAGHTIGFLANGKINHVVYEGYVVSKYELTKRHLGDHRKFSKKDRQEAFRFFEGVAENKYYFKHNHSTLGGVIYRNSLYHIHPIVGEKDYVVIYPSPIFFDGIKEGNTISYTAEAIPKIKRAYKEVTGKCRLTYSEWGVAVGLLDYILEIKHLEKVHELSMGKMIEWGFFTGSRDLKQKRFTKLHAKVRASFDTLRQLGLVSNWAFEKPRSGRASGGKYTFTTPHKGLIAPDPHGFTTDTSDLVTQ